MIVVEKKQNAVEGFISRYLCKKEFPDTSIEKEFKSDREFKKNYFNQNLPYTVEIHNVIITLSRVFSVNRSTSSIATVKEFIKTEN